MGRGSLVSEAVVWERLEAVNDAHIPVSLRKMGMIQGVVVSDAHDVTVHVAIPCLACPAISMMHDQIRTAVTEITGVRNVAIDGSGAGSWSRDHVDASAKPFMRQFGLQI